MPANIKHTVFTLCLMLLCSIAGARAEGINKIYIPAVEAGAGTTVTLPVYINNADDIVAFEFTLALPDTKAEVKGTHTFTDRAADHQLSVQSLGSGRYKVIAYSATNSRFAGQAGKVLNLSLSVPSTWKAGEVKSLVMSDAVLAVRSGDNVMTGSDGGSVTVTAGDYADLVPSAVSVSEGPFSPGGELTVQWTVTNNGRAEAKGGWSSVVTLTDAFNSTYSFPRIHENTVLSAGGTLAQRVTLAVPATCGIEGQFKVRVELIPNKSLNEPEANQGNNTARTASFVGTMGKALTLTLPTKPVNEYAGTVECSIGRSGYRGAAEVVTLTSSNPRLTVPATVTIPAGAATATFRATVVDDQLWNKNVTVSITAALDGYDATAGTVEIIDDETATLTLSTDRDTYTEGDEVQLTVTATAANEEDVTLMLGVTPATAIELPTSVLLPAGQTTASVVARIKGDNTPAADYAATFTVNATNYTSARRECSVVDDDTPQLELILTPATVSESDGPQCVLARLTRKTNVDKAVNVKISSNDSKRILTSVSQIGMAAGVATSDFYVGVVDNDQAEGNQEYDIRAAVVFATKKTAEAGHNGYAAATLNVLDDDGATLKLSINNRNIKEGTSATLTVTRNTATTEALTVSLACDKAVLNNPPATVTIPAGRASTTVTISTITDSSTDNVEIALTASAEGFNSGTCYATIVNQTLPDISDVSISTAQTEPQNMSTITTHVALHNSGTYTLAAGTTVQVLISTRRSLNPQYCQELTTATLDEAIPAGATHEMDIDVLLPRVAGTYYLYAQATAPDGVVELSTANNKSTYCAINIRPPYTVKMTVDKSVVKAGDEVTLTGVVQGSNAAGDDVYLSYEWNGTVYKRHRVTTDANGRFTLQYVIPRTQPGTYRFFACQDTEVSAPQAENTCSLNATGWAVNNKVFVKKAIERGVAYNGSITVTNKSAVPISGVQIATVSQLPQGASLAWQDCPATIAGNATATIRYTLTHTELTDGTVAIEALLTADDHEDIKLSGAFTTYNPYPTLEASCRNINTTATKGRQKTVTFNVGNTGKGATGNITLSLPDFMKALSGATIPSLAYGEYATVTLAVNIDADTEVDTKLTGQIGINCQNGNGMAMPYTIQVVSEATGTLHIDVCDEFTYYNEEAPQVVGAKVEIRNRVTNELVYDGVTNERGEVEQTLTEGHYRIKVSAEGHESYSGTITVDPAQTTVKTVNLAIVDDIKVKYEVVETEVEDVYEIVTTTTFETAIPKPQITFSVPGRIDLDNMEQGQSITFTATVSNKGLITAKNVEVGTFLIPNDMEDGYHLPWTFKVEYLSEHIFDLRPKESMTVTYRVTKLAESCELDGCVAYVMGKYEYNCGTDTKTNKWQGAVMISQQCKDDIVGYLEKFDVNELDIYTGNTGSNDDDDLLDLYIPNPEEEFDVFDNTIQEKKPVEDKDDKEFVVAKVTLQFNQRLTMTRQAFRGTLTIENGRSDALTDIVLSLYERDPSGVMATSHEFEVHPESINGFGGTLDGPWTLAGKHTGVATILYIPTKYAAPYVPMDYTFGGQLSFTDPSTGLTRKRDLTEQVLTVKPSPNLDLTYFMQRDVYSDDPMTAEVEPTEESEFSLIINNVGYGDATKVNMVTQQPQIVDNQQGLLLDMTITRALLNGHDETLAMGGDVVTPFGTIAAHSQAYAQWFFTSSLMGHFTDYNVEATHVTSYDNPDLTLLNEVTIHELIHSIDVPGQEDAKGFLCNDEKDDDNLPDAIYLTDGTKQVVGVADAMTVRPGTTPNTVIVTLKPTTLSLYGWCYGKMRDPKNGTARITRVERLGNGSAAATELSLRNAWITHATMRDGNVPLYENMLHIADCIGATQTEYRITYEDRPERELKVERFYGIPASGVYATEKVTDVQVKFNKEIDPTTFTTDDLTLMIQGNNVSCEDAVITPVEGEANTYNINIANVAQADGLYVLTVQTRTINDGEGYYGAEGQQCSWSQMTGEKVELKFCFKREGFGTIPADACTITLADDSAPAASYDFGTNVTLKATPAYGYTFDRWAINGTTLSTDATYTYRLTSAKQLQLWLTPVKFAITIEAPEVEGEVSIGSGQYEYGEELELTATPKVGYRFDGWYEDTDDGSTATRVRARRTQQARTATKIGDTPTITYTVQGAANIYPMFVEDVQKGDTNNDGVINITDYVNLIDYINYGDKAGVLFNSTSADVNGDGQINITDAVNIIEIINNQ